MIDYDNLAEFGTITCDDCAEEIETYGTFQDVVDEAKADNWRISKDDATGEWTHSCSGCR